MSDLSPWLAMAIAAAIIALSAFFVAVEFALVAARRYRLEDAAESSASARAALASARELSLLLAGSQLGITLCTLALGAVAKPAVHHMLTPVMQGWGVPTATADVVAFVLSLVVVTFLHLVVGEMAPKSWAIAHPERSATMLAIPMRVFMWFTRPLLLALNGVANWCLHRVGVEAVDEVNTGRTPDDLRQLVDHSAEAGALDPSRHEQLATALDLRSRRVRDVMAPREDVAAVPPTATVAEIQEASRTSGHLRLVVHGEGTLGVVHVRDTLAQPQGATAAGLMRPAQALPADTPVHTALTTMRDRRDHLALVKEGDAVVGLVTMQDLLDELLYT
ncbi:hemolysin family protein [Prauserella endophytica]|uniref:HlyC/CorC family transporter n=1 Tax=Prauserella endophytica TaxID=1592324 RepID=A0ABY2SAA3_9PSEU|nr:hemolysin family protein [Prauserella endophytica]TKG72254.1 HlyC/CorC family transporter [Prauserella endophytica]